MAISRKISSKNMIRQKTTNDLIGGSSSGSGGGSYVMYSNLVLAGGSSISIDTTSGFQTWEVSSSSGAVTLSTTPFGASAPLTGAIITLIGRNDTNTVELTNNDISYGCLLNGNITLGYGDSITLQYLSSINRFVELNRNS